ncbi:MAG: hypothetical protein NT120_05050 [Candidatus Aenigmarchaeota archaeon]|nr:hypothetical protein [Candidatus Aenigmarchaeota archaeon]
MKVNVCPEYRGTLAKVFLPHTGDDFRDAYLERAGESLRQAGSEIKYVDVPKMSGIFSLLPNEMDSYSLWLRDPCIFLGYDDGKKPVVLMTDDVVLYTNGTAKDISDKCIMREHLEDAGAEVIEAPFFVVGGDCLITEQEAIFGWLTAQLNGWGYGNHERGTREVRKVLDKFELDAVFLDDVGKTDKNMYDYRRLNGFFHLDTVASFLPGKNAVVSETLRQITTRDNQGYENYVTETLDKHGYKVLRAPAVLTNSYLWSPTNVLVDESKKIIFLSKMAGDEEINSAAAGTYSKLGYRVQFIDVNPEIHEQKGGVRCLSFAIKSE